MYSQPVGDSVQSFREAGHGQSESSFPKRSGRNRRTRASRIDQGDPATGQGGTAIVGNSFGTARDGTKAVGISAFSDVGDGVLAIGRNGVHGQSSSDSDSGVWGENIGTGVGVRGTGGIGVNGRSTQNIGVLGSSATGNGVEGVSGSGAGVRGTGPAIGVQGDSNPSGFTLPTNVGVWGECNGGIGVVGSSSKNRGVFGYCDGAHDYKRYPELTFVGVHGQSNSNRLALYDFGFLSHVGVYGDGGIKGCGVYGKGGAQIRLEPQASLDILKATWRSLAI